MLSVAEARSQILALCRPLPAESVSLSHAILGRVLARSVAADIDMPPFDKASMDGYAVRVADLGSGKGCLSVVGEVCAGQSPTVTVGAGQAVRIMTGAPVPAGADAVVVVEKSRLLPDGRVEIDDAPPSPRQNIIPRAEEMAAGEVVLNAGAVLRPREFGLLATLGRTSVMHIPPPRVGVMATGDELVEADQVPGPGQIRNSNAPMLLAQVARAGGVPRDLGIGPDKSAILRMLVNEALRICDILILSGGVSAGKLDLVPGVLEAEGVRICFHKVRMKPGKPLLFGTAPSSDGGEKLIFGLPGNPVSSLVCFELFIRPAIRTLAGLPDVDLPVVTAELTADFTYRTDRPTYYPARLEVHARGWRVEMLPWLGSANLRALLPADGLAVLPAGELDYRAGQCVDVLRLDT